LTTLNDEFNNKVYNNAQSIFYDLFGRGGVVVSMGACGAPGRGFESSSENPTPGPYSELIAKFLELISY